MRIKDGFVLREVAGQGMVIATGEASKSFHGMIKLNTTGSFVWKSVEEGKSTEEIAQTMAGKFAVDIDTAKKDTEELITKMKEAGFVVE